MGTVVALPNGSTPVVVRHLCLRVTVMPTLVDSKADIAIALRTVR